MKNRNILVSGAGIAGPTLAYWLLQRGFTPTLVEQAPSLRTGGYMIDFWGLGWEVSARMNLLPRLLRDGYRMTEVRLVHADDSPAAVLDANIYQKVSGNQFISVLRGDLAAGIYSLIDGKVETIFNESVQSIQEDTDGVDVQFARSGARRFDLVIGADGLHSSVRTAVWGNETQFRHDLGYQTASFSVADYPHRDEDCVYHSYCAPGRQVARYTLRDGRTAFFFVYVTAPGAPVPRHPAEQRDLLRRIYGNAGWECPTLLSAMDSSNDLYLDSVSQIRMPSWSTGRVALVGDAASCPSLLAGQGSAFAMAGAYLLAAELEAADGDHATAFARYQEKFKPFIEGKQKGVKWFGSWFAPKTRLGVHARNLSTRLMNAPVISKWMAKQMLADSFTLPPQATPQTAIAAD